MKKLLAALLLTLLAAFPAAAAEKRFHILMINDPHSYILPYREAVTNEEGRQSVVYTGGMARALELVREERAKIEAVSGAPVFLFEAGDVMLGLKGALTAGEAGVRRARVARLRGGSARQPRLRRRREDACEARAEAEIPRPSPRT